MINLTLARASFSWPYLLSLFLHIAEEQLPLLESNQHIKSKKPITKKCDCSSFNIDWR